MSSARTQISYLSPALSPAPPSTRKSKLRREERDRGGNVLPLGSGTGYGQTNGYGQTSNGSGSGGHLAPRIQAGIQQAKDRRQHRGRRGDTVNRNLVVDEDGVAHDSEYVQFRTATPVHLHSQRHQTAAFPNDDDSASSSSSSSNDSDGSGFPSSPYTYQSTHRTTTSTHHHYANGMGTTGSAIPGYLSTQPHRTSLDHGSSSLAVPRAPSPRRASADYDRPGTKTNGKARASSSTHREKFTTSSYQPPAPAFSSRPMDFNSPLRLPTAALSSGDGHSLSESTARMSLNDTGGSGYNQYASTRPPKLDGTALDAGVHGMKRSWDGFKLEMKFGAHKVGKKVSRKITNL